MAQLAPVKCMPTRGHQTTPRFNPNFPRELRAYFSEIEQLFADCGVTTFDEKKRHVLRYVDVQAAELWEVLPEYISEAEDAFKL
jgi:hypothetical protein